MFSGKFWRRKQKQESRQPFRRRKSLGVRLAESEELRRKFPTKLPIVVERYDREATLPMLAKTKFLLPREFSMRQFAMFVRDRAALNSSQSLFLFINRKVLVSMTSSLQEVYDMHKDDDGFLYVTYASQEVFGNDSS